jgi:hypothetical protein
MDDAVNIDAARTPTGKGEPGGQLAGLHAVDLHAYAIRSLLERTGIDLGQPLLPIDYTSPDFFAVEAGSFAVDTVFAKELIEAGCKKVAVFALDNPGSYTNEPAIYKPLAAAGVGHVRIAIPTGTPDVTPMVASGISQRGRLRGVVRGPDEWFGAHASDLPELGAGHEDGGPDRHAPGRGLDEAGQDALQSVALRLMPGEPVLGRPDVRLV